MNKVAICYCQIYQIINQIMLHKRFIYITTQAYSIFKSNFTLTALRINKNSTFTHFHTSKSLQNTHHRMFNNQTYAFSSFKDEYNDQTQDKTAILKQFQGLIKNFQSSYDAGKYEQARQHLQKSAEMMKKANCHNSIQYVQIMLNLVATVKKYNLTQRIISALEEAEQILEKLPEANYSHKQIVYSHLSYEYDVKRQHVKTIQYLTKLIKLFQKTDIQSMEVAHINQRVGELYLELNKLQQAIPFFRKALELLESKNAVNTKEYLKILDDLSFAYYNLNMFEQLEELRLKSLKTEEVLSGKQSMAYASHLKNIGLIYKRLNKFDKYVEYLEEALAIAQAHGEKGLYMSKQIKQNLGVFYFHNKQDFEKALPLLQGSLSLLSKEKQQDKYLYFLRAIAQCHKNLKQYELSKENYKQIVEVLQISQQKGCQYAYILSEVGLAHYNLDQYEESLQYYLRSLAIQQEKHGQSSQTCIQLYQNIAQVYYLLGNKAKSLQYARKVEQYKENAVKHH